MDSDRATAVPSSREAFAPSSLRQTAALLEPYRRSLLLVFAAMILSGVLTTLAPFVTKAVFDSALFPPAGGPDLGMLTWLALGLIAIAVATAVISAAQSRLTGQIGNSACADLRTRVFEHLLRMEPSFPTASSTASAASRLAADVNSVQRILASTAGSTASDVVTVAAVLVAMVILSWQLTVAALIIMAVFVIAKAYAVQRTRRLALRTEQATAFNDESLVSGIMLAKLFGRAGIEEKQYREESRRQARLDTAVSATGQIYSALARAVSASAPAVVYLVAGRLIAPGSALTAGTLVAFTILQLWVQTPLTRLAQASYGLRSSLTPFHRIFGYLRLAPSVRESPVAISFDPALVRGGVELRDVWFSYPPPPIEPDDGSSAGMPGFGGGFRWALAGLDMRVEPGQLAAVVGPEGSGKTTATCLIRRFYDVDRGACLIDGVDVRDIALASLARVVGMVTKAPFLFYGAIRDNLAYARPEATEAEIEEAARDAGIHGRIMSFKHGYDTIVGERGHRLSGSEKQRLAIARVLLCDPRVLIVEEATTALDRDTEHLVQEALDRAGRGRTTIALAHRLSTLMKADVIFALDRGEVVEQGTHDQLLAKRGLYWRLYLDWFGGGQIEARLGDGVKFTDGTVLGGDRNSSTRADMGC